MKKILIIFFSLVALNQAIQGQYLWQDPLEIGSFDVVDKYALLYNIGAVFLSGWLSEKDDFNGMWETAVYAEFHQEYNPNESTTDVFMGKARMGKQFQSWVQLGGEAQLMKFKNADVSAVGFGGAVYFNWYFFNRAGFRVYFDNAFGVLLSTRDFPLGGSSFNFSKYYGISMSLKIQEGNFLKLGVRNMHISNAFLYGDDRNPAFDSIGFHIGFEFGNSKLIEE